MSSSSKAEPHWPQIGEYDDHVANLHPKQLLKDSKLWGMQVEMKPGTRSPKVRCGSFGGVYKFSGPARSVALKLFTGKEPARELRYRLIHEHLGAHRDCPYLVGFEYQNDGILCNGSRWPLLAMDWIEGERLDLHLNRIFQNSSQFPNGAFCQRWVSLVRDLDRRGIAHGDLQSGNVLVLPNGGLKLVDYDGMFVTAMNGMLAQTPELGLPAFQHPKRVRDFFDQRLDYFSALVILLTFACLDGDLWQRFNGGSDDQCLLFRAADFRAPEQSELMDLLLRAGDPVVRKLAVLLKAACQGGLYDVPPFSVVARDSVVARATDPSWAPTAVKPAAPKPPPPPPPRRCHRCGALLDQMEGKGWQCAACAKPGDRPEEHWRPSAPTLIRETRVLACKGPVTSVALSPDGRIGISCGYEMLQLRFEAPKPSLTGARVWDVAGGREIRVLAKWVGDASATFSPDGRTVLTGFFHKLRLWNTGTGKEIRHFTADLGWITSVAFTPDGSRAIAAGEKMVRVWEIQTGKEVLRIPSDEVRRTVQDKWKAGFCNQDFPAGRGVSIAVKPDGRSILLHLPQGVRLYDLGTGDELASLDGHGGPQGTPSCNLAISPDGKAALIGRNQGLALWDLDAVRVLGEFAVPGGVRAVAFTPDGLRACAGGGDHQVHIWDIRSGVEIARLEGHTAPVEGLAISADGRWALTGSHDQTVRVWSLAV